MVVPHRKPTGASFQRHPQSSVNWNERINPFFQSKKREFNKLTHSLYTPQLLEEQSTPSFYGARMHSQKKLPFSDRKPLPISLPVIGNIKP